MDKTKLTISLVLMALLLISCQGYKNKNSENALTDDLYTNNDLTDDLYLEELVERQLEKSKFFISIPADYTIEVKDGADFYVCYFYSADTNVEASFNGGIYFGNHPDGFSKDGDSCKTENTKSTILYQNADWKIYNCNEKYSVQTIIENYKTEGWDDLIHAFGHANSKADLIKLMTVFKTIKREEDSDIDVFIPVEHHPEYPGGNAAMMKFLSDNMRYPVIAMDNGIQGRVILNFIVNEDGSLSDIQVVRGVDPELDKEAVRLVKSMPKWIPGEEKGEKVKKRFTLPIIFRLDKSEPIE